MTSHTPGPWGLMEHRDGYYALTPPDGRCSYFGKLPCQDAEDHANAALISAAPDLLAALVEMHALYADHAQYDEEGYETAAINAARAAIDKATSKGHGKKTPKAEMDANARLISAAPDLLEALEGAIETADGTPGMSEAWWYSPARVAIAKATSQQGQ